MRETHDHYFRQAKRDGFVSRAAYKLIEIDDRRRLLRHGQHVLDCGCAPGSWLQVASERVGPRGIVAGIDLSPIRPAAQRDNVRFLRGDLGAIDPDELRRLGEAGDSGFDVVLSDIAPSTTGDQTIDHHASIRLCELVLQRCDGVLARDGHLVMKVFEGEACPELMASCRRRFARVKGFKPKASRSISREMFVIAEDFRPPRADEPPASEESGNRPPPPRRPPSPGWITRDD